MESSAAMLITFFEIACLGGILIIAFAYLGFPLTLKIIEAIRQRFGQPPNSFKLEDKTVIQVVISCFNEADIIGKRIENALKQACPNINLSVLVISDGSTDNSEEIVREIEENNKAVKLFSIKKNCGKNNALNSAFDRGEFKGDLLCFTDSDSVFEPGAISSATRFFSSPSVGLVGGNISYWLGDNSAHKAEGFFWRLEKLLREAEGDLGWLVSCSGGFIMMRRELFQPLPEEANTDFALPLMVLAQGYETRFDKQAVIRSQFPVAQPDIIKRRKRTIIRALTTMAIYRKRLGWHLRGVLFWHKTVRFYAFPFQVGVLATNVFCLLALQTWFWAGLGVLQIIFYSMAILGWLAERARFPLPMVHLPYQFTLQNTIAFSAVMSFLRGERISKWTPPREKTKSRA